jgi:hypothetical protein
VTSPRIATQVRCTAAGPMEVTSQVLGEGVLHGGERGARLHCHFVLTPIQSTSTPDSLTIIFGASISEAAVRLDPR